MGSAEIKIPDAATISQQITDAIADSVIGEKVREAIDESVKDLKKNYYGKDDPFQRVINEEIRK